MPAPGSAWSRSEWLRRLGYKTGSEPPIASAIQPTLRSGDASELLPPLLAPQGWARPTDLVVPGGGTYAIVEVIPAIGGTVVHYDGTSGWTVSIESVLRATSTFTSTLPIYEEREGVRTVLNVGSDTAAITDGPRFSGGASLLEFVPTRLYCPPSFRLYIEQTAPAAILDGALHVRDVPVGLAPD